MLSLNCMKLKIMKEEISVFIEKDADRRTFCALPELLCWKRGAGAPDGYRVEPDRVTTALRAKWGRWEQGIGHICKGGCCQW